VIFPNDTDYLKRVTLASPGFFIVNQHQKLTIQSVSKDMIFSSLLLLNNKSNINLAVIKKNSQDRWIFFSKFYLDQHKEIQYPHKMAMVTFDNIKKDDRLYEGIPLSRDNLAIIRYLLLNDDRMIFVAMK
jgi:hypothetical protein